MRADLGYVLAAAVGLLGCGGGAEDETRSTVQGVGEPCSMSDEGNPTASGFSLQEVVVEDTNRPGAVCLSNHFRGRVSCPYGQTAAELSLPSTAPERCLTPSGDPVDVVVQPQLSHRRDSSAVYVSCRCDGPNAGAQYCACPSGFACEQLIDDLGVSTAVDYAGSYCVIEGTQYDPSSDYGPACDRDAVPGSAADCG